jgi:HSP20 family protein
MNLIRREKKDVARPRPQESWDPFRMMDALMRWDPFGDTGPSLLHRTETFLPRFDVKESKDGYLIRADLPGVVEKDLEVSLSGNVLTVSGHREDEHKQEDERYYAMERSYGEFTRSFSLPESADAEHIRADLKDGVLSIALPKRAEAQSRKITVGTSEKPKS